MDTKDFKISILTIIHCAAITCPTMTEKTLIYGYRNANLKCTLTLYIFRKLDKAVTEQL